MSWRSHQAERACDQRRCHSTKTTIEPRPARLTCLAKSATARWNGCGRGRRWRSTACGADIRARAARRSFPASLMPSSPAAWCPTKIRMRSPKRSSPISKAICHRRVRLEVRRDHHDARPYRIPAEHAGLTVAATVLEELYGRPPFFVRMGGTLAGERAVLATAGHLHRILLVLNRR